MSALSSCVDQKLIDEARATVRAMRKRKKSVVTAESCTGGLIAALISHAPWAGDCLQGGVVVYSKELKASLLGVNRSTLEKRGSVNREVAVEMARGALRHAPADIALAVTGVLGPKPDEDGNPPGMVVLALAQRGGEAQISEELFANEPPDLIRRKIVIKALHLLRLSPLM